MGTGTSDPPIRREKWRIQVKLAILARENVTMDKLLQPKPTHVRLPAEPKYEMPIEDATEQTERDRQIRNSQLKLQWELKCQKITEAGHGYYAIRSAFHFSTSVLERKDDVY